MKKDIEPPPESISREALGASIYVLLAFLKMIQEKYPHLPFERVFFDTIRHIQEFELQVPGVASTSDNEIRVLVEYLRELYDDPSLDLFLAKTTGIQ